MTEPTVGILIRVSTKRQGERGASPQTQKADVLAYAERQGWQVALVEEDHETGTDFDRAGYQRLLTAAREGRIEGVVVRDLSRFGRGDLGATIAEFNEFRSAGCFIASALDGLILQPTEHLARRLDVGVKVLVNGYYSAMLAENVPPNMTRRVQEGKWVSNPPFGYRLVTAPDGKGVTLTPDENAWAVPELFNLAAEGRPETELVAFARAHNLRSYRTPEGQTLTRTSIRRILENPAYTGKVVWNRRGVGRFRDKGKRPDSEIVTGDGLHPPLVDGEIFERVQARLKERRTYKTYTKTHVYMLDGLIFCGRCGAKMRGHSKRIAKPNGKRYPYRYYTCATRHDRYACDQPSLSATMVEREVRGMLYADFLDLILDPARLSGALRSVRQQHEQLATGVHSLRASLEKRLADLRRRQSRLLDDDLADRYPASTIEEKRAELQDGIAAVEGELARLQPDSGRAEVEAALAWLEGLAEKVSSGGIVPAEMRGDGSRTVLNIYGDPGLAHAVNVAAFNAFTATATGEPKRKPPSDQGEPIKADATLVLEPDDATWQTIARALLRRVEVDGSSRNGGTLSIEYADSALSVLEAEGLVSQIVLTVCHPPAHPRTRR